MGPCPFRHGYAARDDWLAEYQRQLQWGHALSGMDMLILLRDACAKSELQWGHALSGMDIAYRSALSTRGGTLQWGHALSGMDITRKWPRILRNGCASMGPCPFRHGYTDIKTASPCNCTRFNGAMPFQAWLCVPSSSIIDNISSASMGPCPFRHGYWHVRSRPEVLLRRFNGAMPFQAWIL